MFVLPELPYAYDALEPVISVRTMRFHHDKHHVAYVKAANERLGQVGGVAGSLEDVVREAARSGDKKLFDNAAQAWNHAFFWVVQTPSRIPPAGELASAIDLAFGNLAGLKQAFVAEGAGHFGSGWAWLVSDRSGSLKVVATHDAGNGLMDEETTPLLVCDLWEHAYYLDHQNDRKGFLEAWFDALPHWEFASVQYAAARGRGEAWRYPDQVAQPRQARAG